jgi:4a-hydroxytetrahydrobiopterin dehydratase
MVPIFKDQRMETSRPAPDIKQGNGGSAAFREPCRPRARSRGQGAPTEQEVDTMAQKLTGEAREAALEKLSGWSEVKDRDAIARKFTFKDFNEAFGFMTRAALIAEKLDHHPEWFNVYKTVEVTLATHDAGGVTELDIRLAEAMNRLAP